MSGYGIQSKQDGPAVDPNLKRKKVLADDVDAHAARFGNRLVVRIDPRDFKLTRDNPTGLSRYHDMATGLDDTPPFPARATGAALSVGTISGKFNGRPVFKVATGVGVNDFKVGPYPLTAPINLSIFGALSIDASMEDASGTHPLLSIIRAGTITETLLHHQYVSTINYLSAVADTGDSGGVNINIDTSAAVDFNTPFAYLLRMTAANASGLTEIALYINQVETVDAGGTGIGMPDAGSVKFHLGCGSDADADKCPGGYGRHYVVAADVLATADDAAISARLMLELMNYYGIPTL